MRPDHLVGRRAPVRGPKRVPGGEPQKSAAKFSMNQEAP
jgi:hypothetical protein